MRFIAFYIALIPLEKDMNLLLSLSSYGEIVGQAGLFNQGMSTSGGEKNSDFKSVKLSLKIDLVSHPASVEGLGKYKHLSID